MPYKQQEGLIHGNNKFKNKNQSDLLNKEKGKHLH